MMRKYLVEYSIPRKRHFGSIRVMADSPEDAISRSASLIAERCNSVRLASEEPPFDSQEDIVITRVLEIDENNDPIVKEEVMSKILETLNKSNKFYGA